ncbi:hypothetical protein TSMEX_002107 [Taenia solium]|eukprot:TsM_000392400 transcript=TsM_000392400 gene=TsM_000392400
MNKICILLWICLGQQQIESRELNASTTAKTMEKAPLLPHFNRDYARLVTDTNSEKTLVASLGNAFITWREKEPIELSVEYFCRLDKECFGEFTLNSSQKLAEIEGFSIDNGPESVFAGSSETYYALLRLVPRREQGIAIIHFQLTVIGKSGLDDHLDAQYLVHLQPPHKRILTQGCTFRVQAHNKANLMIFHFNPNPFMPSGMKWQKFVVYKRVSVAKPQAQQYLYVPLIVMSRSPFSTVPLTFYYFKEVTIEVGDRGRLLVKGTTGNGLNLHDCGMYTVRWYTYDRTHILDEECEDTSQVAFWSHPPPSAPIFAHTKRDTPEEWTFDLKELQAAVRQEPTSAIVACVWTDVFQNIPETRSFALVITRRAFYSEGEELGFMMYAYLMTFTSPSLEGYACHTESMALAGMRPYIPFPQGQDRYSIEPAVSVDKLYSRFTIRADYICEKKKGDSRAFVGITATASNSGYLNLRVDTPPGKDACDNPHQSASIYLADRLVWHRGGIIRFIIRKTKGNVIRVVPMDADNCVRVTPPRALYTQEVKMSCFKRRLYILVNNGIDVSELEYIEMSGEVGPNNYLPIASYTPDSGYEVNTKNIDSSAKLSDASDYFHSLTLTTMAYHLHTFRGFRCRMKFHNDDLPEYEVVNREPVCFVRRPPPILMTVDNVTVPTVEGEESILRNRKLQIFQTSCIKSETQLVFTCSQWREMETCDDAHTVDSVYNVDTDLIIYDTKKRDYVIQKPVFDRLGRGRVDIPTVPHEWHIVEVVCHRTIRRADKVAHTLIDQYSSAVRLCVRQMTFTFYLTQIGFEWTTGLTMPLENIIRMGATTELDVDGTVNEVDVGSAIICRVTANSGINNTEIKRQNVGPDDKMRTVRIFGYENASIAMLMSTNYSNENAYIALFCQARRLDSQIVERSEVLWLVVHETVLEKDGTKEVNDLIVCLLLTITAGLLIAASCPLIAMLSQRRRNRQRARHRKAAARKLKRLNYLREIGLHKGDTNGELTRKLSPKTNIFAHENEKRGPKAEFFQPDEMSQIGAQNGA